jgi:hypothetical protein
MVMSSFFRAAAGFLLLLSMLAFSGCGDDNGSGSNSDASRTPFIVPEALTTAQALALLDEIETLVQEPNGALVALAQVGEAQVQERSLRILNGVDDVSGLDDVRGSLESADRVGAGEYLFNVVRDDTEPLSDPDTQEIDEETLDEIDLTSTFDEDHSDQMIVSGVYKNAVTKMMQLWYGLLGVPPEDTAEPT